MKFLKDRVHPVRAQDAATVCRLIEQLNSPRFADRTKAQAVLEKMGEGAVGTIKATLAGKVNEETRRRLEALVRKCDATSTGALRESRAVAALEWIGTPTARALLRTLAEGAPHARLTAEARGALRRLQVRTD